MLMLQENNRFRELLAGAANDNIFLTEELFDGILTVLACLGAAVCLGILVTLCRFVSYDLEQRGDVRRLLHALGYQRTDILFYEVSYVVFDLVCAYVMSLIMIYLIWLLLKGNEFAVTLCDILGTSLFIDGISFVCPAVLIVAAAVILAIKKTTV